MTTRALEHDGSTQASTTGRLGAIAGVTPVVMFLAWTAVSRWSGTPLDFLQASAVITTIAVVAGRIVGAHSGSSSWSAARGVIAYPLVVYLLGLLLGSVWSIWTGLGDGALGDPATTVWWRVSLLLYALVSAIYMVPILVPFGAGWALTYFLLRRGMQV